MSSHLSQTSFCPGAEDNPRCCILPTDRKWEHIPLYREMAAHRMLLEAPAWKGEKHFQELGVWWLSFIVIEERMRELCSCSSLIKDLLEKQAFTTVGYPLDSLF